jgi:hypothetical protein
MACSHVSYDVSGLFFAEPWQHGSRAVGNTPRLSSARAGITRAHQVARDWMRVADGDELEARSRDEAGMSSRTRLVSNV